MSEEEPMVAGRRRSRGAQATARADALERLKALRSGGRRSTDGGGGFQIKMEDRIYDTVDDDEYEALVAKRREEAKDFIVDDDGLGYGDEGQEEDWSLAGVSLSSEESEGEPERTKRKKNNSDKSNSEKKQQQMSKKPSALSAAAALMGKQRISNMFTSTVFKKNKDDSKAKNLTCDSIVDDVIAEFAPDEADRERRRRGNSNSLSNSKSFVPINSHVRAITGEKPVTRSVSLSVRHESNGFSDTKCETLMPGSTEGDFGKEMDLPKESPNWYTCNPEPEEDKVVDMSNSPRKEIEVEKNFSNEVEVKVDPVAKVEEEKAFKLNATIKEERDPALSATAGWQAVRNAGNGTVSCSDSGEEKLDFELDSDGSLPFYILDVHEELFGANAGNLYLFGKVKSGGTYQSCCVVVKNMQRCVFAIPNVYVFQEEKIMKIEEDVQESRLSSTAFYTELHEMALGLKTEMSTLLVERNVSSFTMTPVKRKYAFERSDIPHGENYVLKINYPFKDPPLPSDLRGQNFSALLGTHSSALENFLVKRKIKGPSWLSISKFSSSPVPQRISWCKFEVFVECPKDIHISNSSKNTAEIPPAVVTAINLKTIINEKQNVNEVVSASVICCHKAKIDAPMLASEWTQQGMLSHFTVIRKLDGGIFPLGFTKEAAERNSKAGSTVIIFESSERALLNRLMIALHKLDTDVLVGHNISGFDLDVLLHRFQACKVPSSMWSKIGRLKRSVMPKLGKANNIFGSGASPGILSCIAGRLLCDTYLCSRDLLKEVSYSLTQLTKTQLNKDRKEIAPHDIPQLFQTSESLMELIEYGETDAWLSMELMFHLSVLPLTRQLTNISGNLWGKTLQGARAQRVEYLLLHAFHARKFIVPDKFSSPAKEIRITKRKLSNGVEREEIGNVDIDEPNFDNEIRENDSGKTKKGPAYAGGLVLEPKKGLYDKYILLLDFNSLYPSIIQEYNICFTTVEQFPDGPTPRLPSSRRPGVLPEVNTPGGIYVTPRGTNEYTTFKIEEIIKGKTCIVLHLQSPRNDGNLVVGIFAVWRPILGCLILTGLLKNLVERRKMVKSWLKTATGLKAQQFDIQQQALKLTANSMYGCLGFSNSRFYAKPLAELITLQGREILQSTVDLVQNTLNLEVIYGDTDSIMIYSGLDEIGKAKAIAGKVIQEVNKKYRCLEIDLDGLYKRMLLLKKKKYAAVKVQFKDGMPYEVIERKGLDMVRRDWSLISKELGDFCLSQILSGGSCDDVVESVHNKLAKVQEDMRNGQIALEKYIITKTLTKAPEAYPDAKSQPHVQVALWMRKNGYVTGCSAGDTVPYVICCEQGEGLSISAGISQRARHPDELKNGSGKWMIDIDYYLAQQIHPVVSRLCAPLQGTSPARLADCLGLDSSKFQFKTTEASSGDPSGMLFCVVDDEERYQGCKPLVLSCPSCSSTFDCPPLISSICSIISQRLSDSNVGGNFWFKFSCPKCPEEGDKGRMSPALLANQVKRQAEGFISIYYQGLMLCDDETCNCTTRSLNLRVVGDCDRGTVCPNYPRCNGRLVRKYTEADLYKQLAYFCYILDAVRCIDKVEVNMKKQVEKELARVRPLVELAASIVQKLRDRCAYGWILLNDLTVSI